MQTVRQHILLHIESPVFPLPNKYVGRDELAEKEACGRKWKEVRKRIKDRVGEKVKNRSP